MLAFPITTTTTSFDSHPSFFFYSYSSTNLNHHHHHSYPFPSREIFRPALTPTTNLTSPPYLCLSKFRPSPPSSCSSTSNDSPFITAAAATDDDDVVDNDDDDDYSENSSESVSSDDDDDDDDGIEFEIENLKSNSRRIKSSIAINASLHTIWNLLTDYEGLADFIPGLAVSRLIQKSDNFARLFQIGEQNLAFGLKFNARGVVDCYERDLENLSFSQRRDIEFKMIEGDFQIFEGRWSIEQYSSGKREGSSESSSVHEYNTTLSYVVDVMPKLWLPVGLVEGRLCREIKTNLSCIRDAAQKASQLNTLPTQ